VTESPGHSANCHDVLIAGGGVSALGIALRLAEQGVRVVVACDADHPGGVITSVHEGGWLMEQGPNSYSSFGAEEQKLLDSIGLGTRVMRKPIRTTDRYIWRGTRLHKVPTGPGGFFNTSLLSMSARLRIVRGLFRRYRIPASDMALGQFFRQLIGDEAVETLLKPLIAGIYAADADAISLRATFPRLGDALFENNRLFSAMKAMGKDRKKDPNAPPKALTTFPDGLIELPRAMAASAQKLGVTIRYSTRPALSRAEDGTWRFDFEDGTHATGREVVLATPAKATAQLVESFAGGAAQLLRSIPHTPLTVAHVGVRSDEMKQALDGFGFLTRRNEGVRMLGMIWSSGIFPGRAPQGHALMTCFYGGGIDPEVMEWTDQQLKAQIIDDLRKTMGFMGGNLAMLRIRRWQPALPLFKPGHRDVIDAIRADLPPEIHISSNWTGGVSIGDRIQNGWTMADEIASRLVASTRRERDS
jgi:oxygen-dependent protoporphyrinogen oxidase